MGYVCASCDVSPEFREFERASTTVINAYVGPLMDRYLGELERGEPASGRDHAVERRTADRCAKRASMRCGRFFPARRAASSGRLRSRGCADFDKALTFDMGGTSTDVALAGAAAAAHDRSAHRQLSGARADAGYPHRGRGRRLDRARGCRRQSARRPGERGRRPGSGVLRSGRARPRSPMRMWCWAESRPINWWAARCRSIPRAAERAVARVGAELGLDTVSAAAAIIRVANSNMERAIRAVSVERGEDPREFPLVAFGGCGGLHACEIAEELGIATVIVPRMAGALSALGMLLADRTRDYSVGALGASDYEARFRKLEKQAQKRRARRDARALRRHPLRGPELRTDRSLGRRFPSRPSAHLRLFGSKARHANGDAACTRDRARRKAVTFCSSRSCYGCASSF